jgi:hypothetical protein
MMVGTVVGECGNEDGTPSLVKPMRLRRGTNVEALRRDSDQVGANNITGTALSSILIGISLLRDTG